MFLLLFNGKHSPKVHVLKFCGNVQHSMYGEKCKLICNIQNLSGGQILIKYNPNSKDCEL